MKCCNSWNKCTGGKDCPAGANCAAPTPSKTDLAGGNFWPPDDTLPPLTWGEIASVVTVLAAGFAAGAALMYALLGVLHAWWLS